MMQFLRKNYGNLIMLAILALVLIPATGVPIKVVLNRIISFSPSAIDRDARVEVSSLDWRLVDRNGNPADLAMAKGKVILINSWATWCPPCIAEMPALQALYSDYGDKVAFFFVSNEPLEVQQAFLELKHYDLPIYRPRGPGPESLRSSSLPTTWLIDSGGEIVIQKTGSAKWNSDQTRALIDELLAP